MKTKHFAANGQSSHKRSTEESTDSNEDARSVSLLSIPINQIAPSPWNPRKRFEGIEQLAQSIHEQGLLQPLIVRPKASENGRKAFELVAGERRFRACSVAGVDPVLCLVQQLDDDQAREIIVTENLQRDDLTPMEEASGVAALLEAGHSTQAIAARIGRDVRWVALRRRILSLHPDVRAAMESGRMRSWSIGHYEALSLLSGESQKEFFSESYGFFDDYTIEELQRQIGMWQLLIVAAPWSPGDASLPGGACAACPKRSSHEPDLFDSGGDELLKPGEVSKEDRCLDKLCWDAKAAAFESRREQELRDTYGDQLVLIGTSAKPKGDRPTCAEYQLAKTKKTSPNSRPGLVTFGPDKGKVKWVVPAGTKTWHDLGLPDSSAGSVPEKSGKRPLEERRAELHAKRRLRAVAQFVDWCHDQQTMDDDEPRFKPMPRHRLILALAATFGTMDKDLSSGGDAAKEQWELVGKIQSSNEEGGWVRLWNEVANTLIYRMLSQKPEKHDSLISSAASAWAEAENAADLFTFDLAEALKDSCLALPEPSSWSKEPGYTPDPMVPDTSADDAARKDLVDKIMKPTTKKTRRSKSTKGLAE
jgi:ParB/RepB/Spo0J family partition protein